nr:hypothetical protein Iba_chr10cCG0110 [Ipomoea batatas]
MKGGIYLVSPVDALNKAQTGLSSTLTMVKVVNDKLAKVVRSNTRKCFFNTFTTRFKDLFYLQWLIVEINNNDFILIRGDFIVNLGPYLTTGREIQVIEAADCKEIVKYPNSECKVKQSLQKQPSLTRKPNITNQT